ncbi:protein translocase SEC61 complex gamma subunit, archaeal and eukaryotic [Edhazardia aedis USNM 41457]|uniref:Protein translocase SEC61 complex gamma subunit, archaeal and eukaryotic n=1 Tax=Edhazardia aedis (strain USNM 41457) TaxID=1003232 RepID=J9DPK7_EDHAE|nr:protein translocase SEC61 complex gamma subunit, archaeal and eukaryotic [Edhazardia aedis USNM 41457]|eukprot:EJW04490.1 protein translocase SEC61 complex gamma subunit, archaeal and eukaryotic [Edhazardia aedis USNM 41457]
MEKKDVKFKIITEHVKAAQMFMKKCVKPNLKEFSSLLKVEMLGIAGLGLVGFFIKIIHIPINNLLVK